MKKFLMIGTLVFAASAAAETAVAAEFYVVRDATTKKCTVVDTKPTTTTTTIVDNGTFKTKTEAETGMKTMKVCTRINDRPFQGERAAASPRPFLLGERKISATVSQRLDQQGKGRRQSGGGSGNTGDSPKTADTSRPAPGSGGRRRGAPRTWSSGRYARPKPASTAFMRSADVVEHQLAFDPNLQFASTLFELPGLDAAVGRQADIDAVDARSGPAALAGFG